MLSSDYFEYDKTKSIQTKTLSELRAIFKKDEVKELSVENFTYDGVRGDYDGKEMYSIHFYFTYFGFKFEFYLDYNQLEYYITYLGKTVESCNYEDFEPEDEHIQSFIGALKNSMIKLRLPV